MPTPTIVGQSVDIKTDASIMQILQGIKGNELDADGWAGNGVLLQQISGYVSGFERLVNFHIGDWWNRGDRFDRVAIVTDKHWRGPSLKTCRNLGAIAARVEPERRRETLPYTHQAELARMAPREADRVMDDIEAQLRQGQALPPAVQMRQLSKSHRRGEREQEMGDRANRYPGPGGEKLYSVLLADPPWQYEPWDRDTGMDRSAENHYSCMTTEAICGLEVPAASNAVLFLWRTGPMAEAALQVAKAWGFQYKSEIIWDKGRVITGYWVRSRHEVLMLCTRGSPVAPAPGEQPESLIPVASTRRHSEKPMVFYEIIETMFPTASKIELFARHFRDGWDAWGNEAPQTKTA